MCINSIYYYYSVDITCKHGRLIIVCGLTGEFCVKLSIVGIFPIFLIEVPMINADAWVIPKFDSFYWHLSPATTYGTAYTVVSKP